MTSVARNVPVLLLVFNRPDPTRAVMECIRSIRPTRLYVAADGPRPGRGPEEAERCARTRAIATEVDWPCTVKTLFRDENLGCKRAVSSAITWIFQQEPQAIILEDDCIPDPSFFPFCAELLDRYRDDESIASICGTSYRSDTLAADAPSYHYSQLADLWGWASWADRWRDVDLDWREWRPFEERGGIAGLMASSALIDRHFRKVFAQCRAGRIDSWGYPWIATNWRLGRLAIHPNAPLVRNVGFGADSTNTLDDRVPDYVRPTQPVAFPLRHPATVRLDPIIERTIWQQRYDLTASKILIGKLRNLASILLHRSRRST